jgi:hypothetical protein
MGSTSGNVTASGPLKFVRRDFNVPAAGKTRKSRRRLSPRFLLVLTFFLTAQRLVRGSSFE